MAYNEQEAAILRAAIGPRDWLRETRMFGGLCFLDRGNMMVVLRDTGGAFFRVGPEAEARALALPGGEVMVMRGKAMRGFVTFGPELLTNEAQLATLIGMAAAFTAGLPAK
ncbi:hypothetical protein FHS89_000896 [Rubricella aquisinus]|uniref:TfoX N-terminal domain-containing protein n=1 Tax=Rubricella aquisinus TaxID=2028108 RepID=A0A840WUK3_9RHOB|nr:TfoX/Sxy family protein [Rubricella aquisinus]MBB5514890.1 hypothetical protein [Rubricella aquisinus]